MSESKNDFSESYSSNLVFLREKKFRMIKVDIWPQILNLKFENTLFLSAHLKILVTVEKRITI